MQVNLGLILTIGAVLLALVLDYFVVRALTRARQRRAAANLPPPTTHDLWPTLKSWLRRPPPALVTRAEILALLALSLAYTYPLLDLRPGYALRGNETEILTGIAAPVVTAVRQGSTFPFWNPYVQYGKSLIADPFLFILNPFISVPMLLLGVNSGAKVAAALAFAIAGVGMWALMKGLGARGPVRLWSAATYMLAGGMPAHLWIGHFQLAVGLAWVPWCFAGVLNALKKRTRWSVFVAVFPIALLLVTGNLYIPLFVLIGLLILFVVQVASGSDRHNRLDRARIFALIGLFALGLTATQFLPEWVARDAIDKGADPNFEGSQTLPHLLTNYLVSEPVFYRQPNLGNLPFVQEYYNYVGVMPFLLLLFLLPAARRRPRAVLVFALLFGAMLAWGAVKFSFVRHLFALIPFLYQFRFPARALRVGGFALIVLAGLGLEVVWREARTRPLFPRHPRRTRAGRAILVAATLLLLTYAVLDLYRANRKLLGLWKRSPGLDAALAWLSDYDASEYAVDIWPHAGPYTHYELGLRAATATLGWKVAPPAQRIAPDRIQAGPKYAVLPADMPVEAYSTTPLRLLTKNKERAVWQFPDALPYAFTVSDAQLKTGPRQIKRAADVRTQNALRSTPNDIHVTVSGAGKDDVLVVLESWFPGWQVRVDGEHRPLLAVDRFLGVRLSGGSHVVQFHYVAKGLVPGLLISIGTALAMLAYMLGLDRRIIRRQRPPAQP